MAEPSKRASDGELRWLLAIAVVAVLAVMVALAVALLGRAVPPATAPTAQTPPATPSMATADPANAATPPAPPVPAVDSADEPPNVAQAATGTTPEPPERVVSTPKPAIDGRQAGFSPPRSPFLQPGETMVRPLPPVRLIDASARLGPAPTGVISWDQAPRYVGQTVTVEGTIVRAHNTGRVCFLNFVENYRGRFYIILFQSALGGWPQRPENYFPGKTIRVTGEVQLHNSSPQIQVRAADQIQIITSE
jgi:hypothetical protein